ncbi:hypothetical protein BGW80DRAFT_456223 [Lactifluus volemus]|nr:hypothetical protein BGW80DRAFT_456223 [Lactifluus volemus]
MPNVAGGDDLPKPVWTPRRWFLPSWRLDYFSKLKFAKNVVATTPHPIYNLPVEVLHRIFIFCADSEPYPSDRWRNYPLKMEPKWVSITYVCRYWRAVALEYHLLWGFLTPNLSPAWIRVFMARSAQTPVDADLRVGKPSMKRKILWVKKVTLKRTCLSVHEVISLLSYCKRLRSLRLVGSRRDVCAVLDAFRSPTAIHSLTLSILDAGPPVVLPVEMFGGLARIRHINFTATRCIVPPRWLLRGVTHFTSSERLRLSDLLFVLRQMPALTHFTLHRFGAYWEESDAPVGPPIPLPYLTNLVVREASPHCFAMLNERLALPQSCKRHLILHTTSIKRRVRWAEWFDFLLPIIEAMDGLQHVYIAGRARKGTSAPGPGMQRQSMKMPRSALK